MKGFRVETAADGQEALEKARRLRPDLIVLDLMMPKVDGWEVCRRLRKESNVPVIMLTARTDDVDKIVGLELGADDYVTKPFNPRELVARVKAVLRRSQNTPDQDVTIDSGDIHIDPARREVTVGGTAVQLRAKEFDLLLALAQEQGRVLTREALLQPRLGLRVLRATAARWTCTSPGCGTSSPAARPRSRPCGAWATSWSPPEPGPGRSRRRRPRGAAVSAAPPSVARQARAARSQPVRQPAAPASWRPSCW